MFKVKTTIVLGAGASQSYGYPTGSELISHMIKLNTPLSVSIEEPTDDPQKIKNESLIRLHQALKFYDPISIDSFLLHYEHDQPLIDEAKKLIAQILLTTDNTNLFGHDANNSKSFPPSHWYRFLWDAIVSEQTADMIASDENSMNFEIVTFNYDNSLEFFLANCIYSPVSMFNDQQKHLVAEKIGKRIHHVYGSLNNNILSGFNADNTVSPIYYPRENYTQLETLVNQIFGNIKLINDRKESRFDNIKKALKNRDQIIFLGFGFDETNIGSEVLDLHTALAAKIASTSLPYVHRPVVKYTNFGDSEIINRRLNEILYRKLETGSSHTSFSFTRDINSVMKSNKNVYRALAEDFRLNNY